MKITKTLENKIKNIIQNKWQIIDLETGKEQDLTDFRNSSKNDLYYMFLDEGYYYISVPEAVTDPLFTEMVKAYGYDDTEEYFYQKHRSAKSKLNQQIWISGIITNWEEYKQALEPATPKTTQKQVESIDTKGVN